MRLTSFEVQGFKNLVAPVKLEGLEPINVLHGANNIGKSNLLQAIEVFFRLVVSAQGSAWLPSRLSEEELTRIGIRRADLFNYATPWPIHMTVSLAVEDSELALAGIQPLLDCKQTSIALSLESLPNAASLKLSAFRFADGTDIVQRPSPEAHEFARRVAEFLTTRALGPRGAPSVAVERRLEGAVDALYDASASTDRNRAAQWARFLEVMDAFRDILGDGRFIAVLPRQSKRARLLYETPTMRIPLHALGSGVQQIVALFGHLLTCGASIVTVEEPELNLRWTLQERVRDVLRDLVVPMTAHIEKLGHLRREKGADYDAAEVRTSLQDAGVEILPLDAAAADAIAERLCQWFPTADAWQDAKWRRLHGGQPRPANKHPPATVDWYTAASCPPGGIVVTGDTRGEFSSCDTIEPGTLERILRELAIDSGSPA